MRKFSKPGGKVRLEGAEFKVDGISDKKYKRNKYLPKVNLHTKFSILI